MQVARVILVEPRCLCANVGLAVKAAAFTVHSCHDEAVGAPGVVGRGRAMTAARPCLAPEETDAAVIPTGPSRRVERATSARVA
jgi:hypothetical protein